MVNKVILVGRLGADPQLRYTPHGTQVGAFRLATNEVYTDNNGNRQERTEWHRVVVFGKPAEICTKHLNKGRLVYVEGSLRTRSWTDKNGTTHYTTEVVARTVRFLDHALAREEEMLKEAETPLPDEDENVPF